MTIHPGDNVQQRYEVLAEIGKGGMGRVYRAQDSKLNRTVAIKELSHTRLDEESRLRLIAEAQTTAQLNHPNIVGVYDVLEDGENALIVMEYAEGQTLRAVTPLGVDEVVRVGRQLCDALEHAHQHGVVHRDIKPENIVIQADGTCKLMDFGIAHSIASRITSDGAVIGTVYYMAPEQAMGKSVDGRADIYSLGVLLYELSAGVLPYADSDPIAIISQHINAPLVPPRAKKDDFPPRLNDLIVKMLSKDPEDRPASAAEVRAALEDDGLLEMHPADSGELSALERIIRGRMVGRKAEFNQAKEIWGQAAKGKGQLLLVSGEPGVGKTRMTREIITHAEVSGGKSFVGASFAEGGTPYAPFRQILRHALQSEALAEIDLPDAVLADLLAMVPDARPRFPRAKDFPTDIQSSQDTLFEHITVFFNLLAAQLPLLLVLEDVHWADSGSLYLMRHLARNITAQPILLLGTYREVELDEALPFNETLLGLEREGLPTRIKLSRLTRDQTRDLLAAMFDTEEITDEFRDSLYRETEGNPFFISEVCKALIESGKVFFRDGKWDRPSIEEMGIPQSVRVAIQSRVGKLSENSQAVLTQAAVLGREFDFATLKLALDQDEDVLIDAIEDALDAQLIEELNGSGEEFMFEHALIPTSIVEGLRTLKRRSLHRRAAQAILERHPEDIAALAYHLLESGDTEQAVVYLLKLGDQARYLYAHDEALDSYLQALDFLVESGDYQRAAEAQMKLALTYEASFNFEASNQAYQKAFEFLSHASPAAQNEALPSGQHTLQVPLITDIPSLDPSKFSDVFSWWFVDNIFSGLVELTPDQNVVPSMAESWEVLNDGSKYVFRLRKDVRWSDGQPVTAHDFRTTVVRALNPENGVVISKRFFDIKNAKAYHEGKIRNENKIGVHAEDNHTLVFEMESPCGYFLHLAAAFAYPVPTHVWEQHGPDWTSLGNIVCNGAYQLAGWNPGKEFRFKRNPDFFSGRSGNVQEVRFLRIPGERILELYEKDEIDVCWTLSLPPDSNQKARSRHRQEMVSPPSLSTQSIHFNHRLPPFNDSHVRRAFWLAIDFQEIVNRMPSGDFNPATGGMIPPGMPGYNPGSKNEFDPERARALLRETGIEDSNEVLEISAICGGAHWARQVGAILSDLWKKHLGISVVFTFHENLTEMGDRLRSDPPPLWLMGWVADFPDPSNFLAGADWQHTTGWQNDEYDILLDKARRSLDQNERLQLYRQAEEILKQEVPIIPIAYGRWPVFLKPWLVKFPFSPLKLPVFKDIIIKEH